MKKTYNSQEIFWKGGFGNKYLLRNSGEKIINNNIYFFKKVFKKKNSIKSLVELGANIGNNILALNKIFKIPKITAVEINKRAYKQLKKIKNVEAINESILEFDAKEKFEVVLIKGVLIHIHPKDLKKVYETIERLSKKYILICEYYNPYPISINYRGYKDKLFKNDYAGDFLKIYKNYKLISYGFNYHLDEHPLDDSSWFLLRKI
jgi:spore coat polysaccharide biosynthesis protein SpsF